MGFPLWFSSKEFTCNAGDTVLIPGSGRSPGEGNDNPLQYSCLGNPMDREAWQAVVHGVTNCWTWLISYKIIPLKSASYKGFPYFPGIHFHRRIALCVFLSGKISNTKELIL